MLVRHATLARYLPSILQRGLLCSKSKGRLKVVWLHTPNKTTWATLHTVRRHGGRVEAGGVAEPVAGAARAGRQQVGVRGGQQDDHGAVSLLQDRAS